MNLPSGLTRRKTANLSFLPPRSFSWKKERVFRWRKLPSAQASVSVRFIVAFPRVRHFWPLLAMSVSCRWRRPAVRATQILLQATRYELILKSLLGTRAPIRALLLRLGLLSNAGRPDVMRSPRKGIGCFSVDKKQAPSAAMSLTKI